MHRDIIKHFVMGLILVGGISACHTDTSSAAKHTIIELSKTEIDLGKITVNTAVEYELSFVNTGEVPLTIYRVTTSCGCTEVEWSPKPIKPQKSSMIKVKYKDKYPGYIHKTITIYGNIEKPIEVRLKGELIDGI